MTWFWDFCMHAYSWPQQAVFLTSLFQMFEITAHFSIVACLHLWTLWSLVLDVNVTTFSFLTQTESHWDRKWQVTGFEWRLVRVNLSTWTTWGRCWPHLRWEQVGPQTADQPCSDMETSELPRPEEPSAPSPCPDLPTQWRDWSHTPLAGEKHN